VHISADMKI